MINLILSLICFALGCINISICAAYFRWINIIFGIYCLTIGIYDIVTFMMKLT